MRPIGNDYSYQGLVKTAEQKFAKLTLPNRSKAAWLAYRAIADLNEGKPRPHIEWDPYANPRHGYEKNIPGYVVELTSQAKICEFEGSEASLVIAEDKHTQVTLKIDFYHNGKTYQCKTVRFKGTQLSVTPDLTTGVADFIILMDIDDELIYVIDRLKLEGMRVADLGYACKGIVHKWDLDRESCYKFAHVFS